MRVPSVIARNLIAYVQAKGKESVKATVMLNSMGWLTDGTRAPQDVIDKARSIWTAKDMKQSTFEMKVDNLDEPKSQSPDDIPF